MLKALRDKGGNQLVIIEYVEELGLPGTITNGVNACAHSPFAGSGVPLGKAGA